MTLRRALNEPIPEIFEAARLLIMGLKLHRQGDRSGAAASFYAANNRAVWNYTDRAWGKGCAARYGFIKLDDAPPRLSIAFRPFPRMPTAETRRAVLARDGYHCRFCGIPVIDPSIRRLVSMAYPSAVTWGATNDAQHAAFQCMWLQFDHVLPNSRGGDSSPQNVVVACAPCNFGRMEATLEEARVQNPFATESPAVWDGHLDWQGLEPFRESLEPSIDGDS